jgi:hypothetical protein
VSYVVSIAPASNMPELELLVVAPAPLLAAVEAPWPVPVVTLLVPPLFPPAPLAPTPFGFDAPAEHPATASTEPTMASPLRRTGA